MRSKLRWSTARREAAPVLVAVLGVLPILGGASANAQLPPVSADASVESEPDEADAGGLPPADPEPPSADGGAGPIEDDAPPPAATRALLASPGLEGQPMKGVYFFPGEGADYNTAFYTAHPVDSADLHWNSAVSTRVGVIERMLATHANTLVMSYWGSEMWRWSPMQLDAGSVRGVIDAVQGQPIVVIPALESGFDPSNPALPHWQFSGDFPYAGGQYGAENLAPSFVSRLRALCELFEGRLNSWAQMYDREGRPRHVVQVLRVYAQAVPTVPGKSAEQVVAEAFDLAAQEIFATEGIEIGFTLDFTPVGASAYELEPSKIGAALERSVSVLATQFFMSEVHAGGIAIGAPFEPPVDNNAFNMDVMAYAKHLLLDSWVQTGLPVIYDVSPGFDGRFIWASSGTGYWGDNFDYTFDGWRNLQSEYKGSKFVGIIFNTWNGYTEGYAAVPTLEHGTTIYDWLTDLYEPDPRTCDHVEYTDGHAGYRVAGPICDKWRELGGRFGMLGLPASAEVATTRGRALHFNGGSVFFGSAVGAHEVHGAILDEYERVGSDASCLGLPVEDEESMAGGRLSRFEFGVITFIGGQANAICPGDGASVRPRQRATRQR